MRYPKGFTKWSLDEQEAWLGKQRQKVLAELDEVSRKLAQVRGGMKIQPQTEERPDLLYVENAG